MYRKKNYDALVFMRENNFGMKLSQFKLIPYEVAL